MNAPIHPQTLRALTAAWVNVLALPPKPRGLLEFARTLRVSVRDPDTGEDRWEPFDPTGHPAQMEIFQAFRAGGHDEMVVLGPVQDGKTYASIIVLVLYCVIELRQSVGLMLPEQDKAEEIWLEKIVPVIEKSGYTWILPTGGRGSKSGADRFMRLNTGATVYLIGAGAKNESAQSSFTVRFMFVDEASSTRPRWIDLAWGRTASYDRHGRRIRTSTIKHDDGDSTILAFNDSTMTRNWFRCPHCVAAAHPSGGWQPFDFHLPAPTTTTATTATEKPEPFARLWYDPDTDETARDTARLICLHDHAHHLTDAERRAALRHHIPVPAGMGVAADGTLTGAALANSRKGIRWTALESPMRSLGRIAVMLHKAKIQRDRFGDHEQLRQFCRDQAVEGYTGDRDAADAHLVLRCTFLAARSTASDYALARSERQQDGDSIHLADRVPTGVEWLTVGVDVNPGGERAPGRLYWLLTGGCGTGSTWDLGWGSVALSRPGMEANTAQLHDGMTRLRVQLLDLAQRFGLPLAGVGIDVGDRQDELRQWLARHKDWQPVKDHAGLRLSVEPHFAQNGNQLDKPSHRRDLAGWIYWRWQREGWWLAVVDTDEVRHHAQTGFLIPTGTPGAFHLPSGLVASDALIAHYCATGRIPDGKGDWRWADRKADRALWPDFQHRRDYLACRTYSLALDYAHRRRLTTPKPPPRKTGVVANYLTGDNAP